jgi:sulfur carrier protein
MTPSITQTIIVNGQSHPYYPQTVRELLVACGIDPSQPGIAVAVNAYVIPRNDWDTTQLQPDDRIEIVYARAGG